MDGRVAAGPWSLIAGGHRFLAKLSPSETHRRPMEGAMEAHRAPLTKGRGNDGPIHTARRVQWRPTGPGSLLGARQPLTSLRGPPGRAQCLELGSPSLPSEAHRVSPEAKAHTAACLLQMAAKAMMTPLLPSPANAPSSGHRTEGHFPALMKIPP